jgi:hypothetical protein
MYKLIQDPMSQQVGSVQRLTDGAQIPFAPANTDYQQFKKNVLAGDTLERPDGTPMTQAEADAYIATLP